MRHNFILSIILTILTSISSKVLACSCPITKLEKLQKFELENSECIFIGEIIEVNESDLTFMIRVTESLDGGDKVDNIYIAKSFSTCDIFTDRLESWIVYGEMENGYLILDECGLSRPVERPFAGLTLPIPIPESINKEKQEKLHKNHLEEALRNSKADLKKEIENLRKFRDSIASK